MDLAVLCTSVVLAIKYYTCTTLAIIQMQFLWVHDNGYIYLGLRSSFPFPCLYNLARLFVNVYDCLLHAESFLYRFCVAVSTFVT